MAIDSGRDAGRPLAISGRGGTATDSGRDAGRPLAISGRGGTATDSGRDAHQPSAAMPGRGGTAAWILQAGSGVLFILLGVHIVAQHFVVRGGLRDYAQVMTYLANPLVLAAESLFAAVLIWHVMAGLRAVLLDFGFSRHGEALITRAVVMLGAATAGYSFWLIATLAAKG